MELVTAQVRIRQWRNALQHLTWHERLPDIEGDPPAALAAACARVFGDEGVVSLMVESAPCCTQEGAITKTQFVWKGAGDVVEMS